MSRSFERRLSPGLVLAAVAMVAAVAGTAVAAGPNGQASVSKKQTKRIAKKQASTYFNTHVGAASVAHAATADRAEIADVAEAAKGSHDAVFASVLKTQRLINYEDPADSPSRAILSQGNLRLRAECAAGPAVTVTATTTVDNATINSSGSGPDTTDDDWDTGDPKTLSTDDEQRNVVYTSPDGQFGVVQYAANAGSIYDGDAGCIAKGVAQANLPR